MLCRYFVRVFFYCFPIIRDCQRDLFIFILFFLNVLEYLTIALMCWNALCDSSLSASKVSTFLNRCINREVNLQRSWMGRRRLLCLFSVSESSQTGWLMCQNQKNNLHQQRLQNLQHQPRNVKKKNSFPKYFL